MKKKMIVDKNLREKAKNRVRYLQETYGGRMSGQQLAEVALLLRYCDGQAKKR